MSAMIKTWRERLGRGPDFPLHAPTDVERSMEAEIAELRAAVTMPEVPTTQMICAIEAAIDSQLVASAINPAHMFRQDGARVYEELFKVAAAATPLHGADHG